MLLKNTYILEGIRNSGKSTQADRLQKKFNATVIGASNPIYDATKQARDSLERKGFPAIPEALLHQFTSWMKLYEYDLKGMIIVDRFCLSHLVYLIARCDIEDLRIDRTAAREAILTPFGLSPLDGSITLYFDCDPLIAQQRITNGKSKKFDYELQSRARKYYLEEIAYLPYKSHIIDASQSPDTVYDSVMQKIIYLPEERDKIKNHLGEHIISP